jgi:hypothetical protein
MKLFGFATSVVGGAIGTAVALTIYHKQKSDQRIVEAASRYTRSLLLHVASLFTKKAPTAIPEPHVEHKTHIMTPDEGAIGDMSEDVVEEKEQDSSYLFEDDIPNTLNKVRLSFDTLLHRYL